MDHRPKCEIKNYKTLGKIFKNIYDLGVSD